MSDSKTLEAAFEAAFDFTMAQEVAVWNPNLEDVKQGKCDTTLSSLRTGYVNHPADPGGETKFGIAKRSHPGVDIKSMTLAEAKLIYKSEYWDRLDGIAVDLKGLMFDLAVNHGVKKALEMMNASDFTVTGICKIREDFYKQISKGKKSVFLNGWLKRNKRCKERYDKT